MALFAALVLSSGAFVLVAAGEAWAQQQPTAAVHDQQQQPELAKQQVGPASAKPAAEQYPAAAGKVVSEPATREATLAVPAAVTSLPAKPPPKPVGWASEAAPKPSPEKAPDPSLSGDPKKPKTEKTVANKTGDALPEELPPSRVRVRPDLESQRAPVDPDTAKKPPASVSAPVSKPPPETAPEPVAPEQNVPFPTSARGEEPAASLGVGPASPPPNAREATPNAASQVLQTLANGVAPEPSSDAAQTSPTKEEGDTTQPPSQPPAPLLPPIGDGPLYSSSGTGHAGPGSGFVVLLVGVLASGLVLLVRRDGPLFLASWEVPKPSSALLLPLERPG